LERTLYQYLEEACSVCGSVLDEVHCLGVAVAVGCSVYTYTGDAVGGNSACRECVSDNAAVLSTWLQDVLMMCENCDYLWHTYCLTPKLDAVPEGEWYCDECARSRKKKQRTE
jgi:hypothetical protein